MHNNSAGSLLDEAKRLVCNERSEHHGETLASFTVIAEFWQTYLRAKHGVASINIEVEDVAQMLSLLKKTRRIFGDKNNSENFIDDLGYTSIAGMFGDFKASPTQTVEAPAKPKGLVVDLNAMEREIRDGSVR